MRRIALFLLATALAFGSSGCIMRSTAETEVGVRTKKLVLFGNKGVEDVVYPPGSTYFFLPWVNDWNTFDTKQQNVFMTADAKSGDRRVRDDLLFKTVDGNDISQDLILTYHIDPKMAPHILQYVASNDRELREKVIRTVARSIPRDILGELKTEEYPDPDKRKVQTAKAMGILQELFAPLGVVVEDIQLKDYRFNPAYQKAIEGKKVAEQLVEKNKSATHAALEEYRKKVEDAKGEVNEMVARANGEFQQAKIAADAYLDKQQRQAEAIEAEGMAEAEGLTKQNQAMAGAGGEIEVKMRVAEALIGKRIILLPMSEGGLNLKTTDMNELLQMQGLRALQKKQ